MTFYILAFFRLRIAINLILIILYNDLVVVHVYNKVRFHPDCKESLHQFLNRLRVIIDPFQQDSLAAKGDARISQPAARSSRLLCDLPRVNKVNVDIQGVVSPEHPAELLRDPLGERARHPRPDPDDIEVGYRSQALQYL